MSIELKLKKEVIGSGGKVYRLVNFKLLDNYCLPALYTKNAGKAVAYRFCQTLCLKNFVSQKLRSEYYTDTIFSIEETEALIEHLIKAGRHLHEVNQKLKKLKEEWNGTRELIL